MQDREYPMFVKLSCSSDFSSSSTYWFYKQTGLGFHSQLSVSRNISGQYLILILMFPEFRTTRSKFRDSSTRQTVITNGWPVIRFSPERCLSALSLNTLLIHSFSLGTPAFDRSAKHKNLLRTSTGRQPLVVLARKSYWFGCNVQFTPLDATTFSTADLQLDWFMVYYFYLKSLMNMSLLPIIQEKLKQIIIPSMERQ